MSWAIIIKKINQVIHKILETLPFGDAVARKIRYQLEYRRMVRIGNGDTSKIFLHFYSNNWWRDCESLSDRDPRSDTLKISGRKFRVWPLILE